MIVIQEHILLLIISIINNDPSNVFRFSSMAKTKEAQAKERERMMAEISNLRERLNAAMTYQDELERKNSSADLRISELQQELEVESLYQYNRKQ